MKLLADTHAYLWWLADDPQLRSGAREAMSARGSTVYVSAASLWEMSIKEQLGKLRIEGDALAEVAANGFVELGIQGRHAVAAGRLPRHHDDPFDRLLIAQAQIEGLVLVTRDGAFVPYGVATLPA